MRNRRVLISGASIAGPALAHWLHRYGFEVTVVEKAPTLRLAGQAVDFKGPVHLEVLRRTGVLDAVRAAALDPQDGAIVNAAGRRVATAPSALFGGDLEIPRGELSRILHEQTARDCEHLFGDTVTALSETATGVDVTFARAPRRTFDLVVGADGMHSTVRRLAYGPERDHVRHLGRHYALADLDTGPEQVMYSEPGRTVILGGTKASAFFVFASGPLPPARDDVAVQIQQVRDAFRGGAWRIPELMAALPAAREFYLDSISRATVEHFSRGRVALLGDAAWGNALGGFGTGLAVVGAYVLAGELYRADGDHERAFERYETVFRPYTRVAEKVDGGAVLAPGSRAGILLRNLAMSALSMLTPLVTLVERPARADLVLQDYEQPLTTRDPR